MTSPSPWRVEASPRGALDSWYVQDAIGEDVCRVRGGEATTEANARLIAAAPELLDLVESFAEGVEGVLSKLDIVQLPAPHGVNLNNLLDTYRALIAQVEG